MVNIDLKRKVYNKEEFEKVVNREFSTFTKQLEQEPITISEFFQLYNSLYFSIPVNGSVESHEYLVTKSSELFNFERDTQNIEPLLNEITKLRERLLTANRRISELQVQLLQNQIEPNVEESENPQIVGCTDPSATNYDPQATLPCSDCCQYKDVISDLDLFSTS